MIDSIEEKYNAQRTTKSDINEHIETLYNLSKECSHITELGVRGASSTWAFLHARPEKLVSYDIVRSGAINNVEKLAKENNINFEFITSDVLKVDIEPTELLFIDTLHTYNQLLSELSRHAKNSSKYIVLHDTTTYGLRDEGIYDHASDLIKDQKKTKQGLMTAIIDFLSTNEGSNWKIKIQYTNNNGLLILQKCES
jgi:hypothetical protein